MAARTTRRTRTTSEKAETIVKAEPVSVKEEPVKEIEKAIEKPVKKEVAKKEVAKKEVAKKEAVKAPEEKKPAAKKPVVKKELKIKTVVEYFGKQVEDKEIVAAVKKAWSKKGKKVGDIKTIDLYIKPEEGAIYYVINDTDAGAVSF